MRRLHRDAEGRSPFLFVSERGSPMTVSNFQKLITKACEVAETRNQVSPPYAAARMRISPSERGAGYAVAASLSRSQEHPAHGQIYRTGTDPVQGLVEGLTKRSPRKNGHSSRGRPRMCPRRRGMRNQSLELRAAPLERAHSSRPKHREARSPSLLACLNRAGRGQGAQRARHQDVRVRQDLDRSAGDARARAPWVGYSRGANQPGLGKSRPHN